MKYINPGYSKLISAHCAYPTNQSADVIPSATQSRTGVAFYNSSSDHKYTNVVDCLPYSSGSEIWFKADIYLPSTLGKNFTFRLDNGSGLYIYTASGYYNDACYYIGDTGTYFVRNGDFNTLQESTGLRIGLNTIWVHVLLDSNNGYIEFKINNKYFGKFYGNTIPKGYNSSATYYYAYLLLYASSSEILFSDIIVSDDEEISPSERVVLLPVSSTVTNMESLASGLYFADTASETILQSVDTSALIQEYGSDTNVTGIALIGNPAYEVDDVISNITSLSKQNDVVTEHEKITLSTSTDAMISSCFSMPTDTTIANLANMQFGWRAEE